VPVRIVHDGAMPTLPPPTDHPDSPLRLEEAIDARLAEISAEAVAAGWSPVQADRAVYIAAMARLFAVHANLRTEEEIRRAIAAIHGD
jgi:hypothetical protein